MTKKLKERLNLEEDKATYTICVNNAEMAAGLTKWLDLDETMIEYLAGDKRQTKTIIKNLS